MIWIVLEVDVEGRPFRECVYTEAAVASRGLNAVKERNRQSNGGNNGKLLLPVNDQGKNSYRKG